MELEFQKTQIPCLRTVYRQVQTQEQTQEVRLNDEMPDIGRVVSCWGQVMLRGKEWHTGAFGVNGGVMAWVLYAPEDGSAPQCLQAWLPMQMHCDLPGNEPDGEILAVPLLYSVDARSATARKITVRASVGILLEGICPGSESLYTPQSLPEDVYTLKNKYPVCVPAEAGEKAFSLEATLKLPTTEPKPAKLLRYELRPEVTDQRLLSDKLIFRGNAVAHSLYADEEGGLHTYEGEIPISQYAELKGEHPEDSTATVYPVLTNLEMELTENGELQVKAGMIGQFVVFDNTTVCVMEDAYSPMRSVQPQLAQLSLPVVLEQTREILTGEPSLDETDCQILNVAFYPEHPRSYRDEETVTAELCCNFRILYRDPEGALRSKLSRWEETRELLAAKDVKLCMTLQPTGSVDISVGGLPKMQLSILGYGESGVPMVTGLEVSDVREPDLERPGLILRRLGEESLWELAKRNGSSVELIKKVNRLQQEPREDQMLLIPVL